MRSFYTRGALAFVLALSACADDAPTRPERLGPSASTSAGCSVGDKTTWRYGVVASATELGAGTPEAAALLDAICQAGVGRVRIPLYWYRFEATGPDDWNSAYAATVARAVDGLRARGIDVYATVEGSPAWARYDRPSPEASKYPPHQYMYVWWQNFFKDLVNAYPGIDYWGVWNEPNSPSFFAVDTSPPETGLGHTDLFTEYNRLVEFAYGALPAGKYLVGPGLAHGDNAADWLTAVLGANGGRLAAVTLHHYQDVNNSDSNDLTGYLGWLNTAVPGLPDKRIWLTESSSTGTPGNPPPWEDESVQATTLTHKFDTMEKGRVHNLDRIYAYHMYNWDTGHPLMEIDRQSLAIVRERTGWQCLRWAARRYSWSPVPQPAGCY